jgi:integrase/recombinase XerC
MPMTTRQLSLRDAITAYLTELEGRNRSAATLRAYGTDLTQFAAWIEATNGTIETVEDVRRGDIAEYLTHLGRAGCTGVSRTRKLAPIRGLFAHLEAEGVIAKSPAASVAAPKSEWREPTTLRQDEYARLLNLARHHPRDTAILNLFLRLGLRVSEVCALHLEDVDVTDASLLIRAGKGNKDRRVDIDKKTLAALKVWFKARPATEHTFVFTSGHNLHERPLSVRGVRWLVGNYLDQAGITKKASCHTLRHTCATQRYANGAPLLVIQRLLGHKDLATTQRYLHPERLDTKKVMEATNL